MQTNGDPRDADSLGGAALEGLAALGGVAFPGLGVVSQFMFRTVRREWERNTSTALKAAVAAAGMSREELAEKIAGDPRLVPLATRLLYAAGMNGHDRTLRAMGGAFGSTVRDRDSIDECELILTALADLTDNHGYVLQLLGEQPPRDGEREGQWTPESLEAVSTLPSRATALCVASLVTRGLVQVPPTFFGGIFYDITQPGRDVLHVLQEYRNADGR